MDVEEVGGWQIGARLGSGGFGQVFEASKAGGPRCVAKFVPKLPGAQRELLFAGMANVRNVVPVLETLETEEHHVLIMPRANRSLSDQLRVGTAFDDSLEALVDIATALVDMDGNIVHRDLKPDNVLLYQDHWCLADFGISRYVEASTATDTFKDSMSAFYAAPEQWRLERATSATDIYAFGIVAWELFGGRRPFLGTTREELREMHLHSIPESLQISPRLAALIDECLYKAAGARPSAANVLARLQSITSEPSSTARTRLATANLAVVAERAQAAEEASRAVTEAERRTALFGVSQLAHSRFSDQLKSVIEADAPSAAVRSRDGATWTAQLGSASIGISEPFPFDGVSWGGEEGPVFDVIAVSTISIVLEASQHGWDGRSHSLYYCDAQIEGQYGWFELAFMSSPFYGGGRASRVPFALDPGDDAAKALRRGMDVVQLAWGPSKVGAEEEAAFVERWIDWFALASQSELREPTRMPEQFHVDPWRQ